MCAWRQGGNARPSQAEFDRHRAASQWAALAASASTALPNPLIQSLLQCLPALPSASVQLVHSHARARPPPALPAAAMSTTLSPLPPPSCPPCLALTTTRVLPAAVKVSSRWLATLLERSTPVSVPTNSLRGARWEEGRKGWGGGEGRKGGGGWVRERERGHQGVGARVQGTGNPQAWAPRQHSCCRCRQNTCVWQPPQPMTSCCCKAHTLPSSKPRPSTTPPTC